MQYISAAIAAAMMGIMGFFGVQGAQQFSAAPSVLKVVQGGTGAATFSAGDCLVGNGTNPITTQPCSAGGGEANTGGSLGTGLNIYDSKSGVQLRFNTLLAGSNITLSTTTNDNTIVIASTASGGSGFSTTSADYYRSVTGRVATSAAETAGQLSYFTSTNGNPATLGGIATGTVSSSGGITTTASRYVLNGALAISCDVASGSIPGCLSAADWTTFNSKAGFGYPFPSNATTTQLAFNGGLTATYSTTTNATTTNLAVTGLNAASCDVKSNTSGALYCGTDATGAGGGAYPFTPDTNYGVLVQATSGIPWFQNALTASSTSYINELFLTEPLSVSSGGTNNSSQTPGGVAYSPAGNSISTGNNFTFDGLNVAIGSSSPNARLSMHLGALDDFIANMFEIGSSTASATTTLFSVANTGVLTSNALSTSTFSGGLSVLNFSQTGTATSSFNNGASFANGTIRLATLVSCSEALETDASGNIICGTDQTGGGGGSAFGQAFELNAAGLLAPTTSKSIAINGTATSTFSEGLEADGIGSPWFSATSSATSTFAGGFNVANINQTGTATSTFNRGITLANGCFAIGLNCIALNNLPGQITLTTQVTGILPIGNGGTNQSAFGTSNGVVYYDGTRLTNAAPFTFDGTKVTFTTGTTTYLTASTFLEIPDGASPLLNVASAIAFDSTDNQLLIGTSTNSSFPAVIRTTEPLYRFRVSSTSAPFFSGFSASKNVGLPTDIDGWLGVSVTCSVWGGTSITIALVGSTAGTSNSVTCGTATSTTALTTNYTYAALENVVVNTTGVSGAPDFLYVTINGRITRE